jgi:heptaprenyl diphosphate synthase
MAFDLGSLAAQFVRCMVENGIMIGQFHPKCHTAAVHDPAWRSVSVAPVPLIAMRKMVIHDILFLREKRWFLEYSKRYGASLERRRQWNATYAFLWSTYTTAKDKFLDQDFVDGSVSEAPCHGKG